MNKDIVYIDVEDDITAIIGKVKAANEKIVALVPPKRIGVLQSAVNLRLLDRAARQHGKQIVVITGNQALSSLAAAAKIPVAKNLQSKPEVGEIAALDIDDGEEIIDGAELPIGDHVATADDPDEKARDMAVGALAAADTTSAAAKPAAKKSRAGTKGMPKVPNFSRFRKKMLLIGIGAVLLIAFLVWAIAFAPHATIVIKAKTSDAGVSQQVTLTTTSTTSVDSTTIQAVAKTTTQNISSNFTATGTKNVGDKATAPIKFSTQSPSGATIPAGTQFTVSGFNFVLTNAVTVPGATLAFGCGGICPGTASGTISAPEGGSNYNGAKGTATGGPSGISASVPNATTGGTDKTATVVQVSDIATAQAAAIKALDTDGAKQALQKQFDNDYIVIPDSFSTDTSKLQSTIPAGGDTTGATPAIAGAVTYQMLAVKKDDLKQYLQKVIEGQFSNPGQQQVYDTGIDDVKFTNVQPPGDDGTVAATMTTKGKIGPKIDTNAVKEAAKGKKLGDVQAQIQQINGVESVTVKFSPFWVNTVPNDTHKVSVQFNING